MFSVDETTAEVIRQGFEESGGELSAAIELRWHFPWSTDYAAARRCVSTIAHWKPWSPCPEANPNISDLIRRRPEGS
jgi:hypothetical protein